MAAHRRLGPGAVVTRSFALEVRVGAIPGQPGATFETSPACVSISKSMSQGKSRLSSSCDLPRSRAAIVRPPLLRELAGCSPALSSPYLDETGAGCGRSKMGYVYHAVIQKCCRRWRYAFGHEGERCAATAEFDLNQRSLSRGVYAERCIREPARLSWTRVRNFSSSISRAAEIPNNWRKRSRQCLERTANESASRTTDLGALVLLGTCVRC